MDLAIGYSRLSLQDQSKYSLPDQEKAIKNFCSANGLTLQKIFTDNGQSSATFDRADWKQLEKFIKEQKSKPKFLIVKALDRFSRDIIEALSKIRELEAKYRLKVLATHEDVNLDPYDPMIFMNRAYTFLYANSELLMIRKRTGEGVRSAQLSGRYVHPAPLGYRRAATRSGGIMSINEEEADLVRFIFREFLQGVPMHEVYDKVREMGLVRQGHSMIKNVLSNPLYAGLVKVKADRKNPETLVAGLHEPIIRESDFWTVQEKLGLVAPKKTQPKAEFPLRGILVCTCGRNMTACNSRGKNRSYPYYLCQLHRNQSYNSNKLHEQFDELLSAISFTDAQLNYIAEQCKTYLKKETATTTKLLQARKDQLAGVEQEIEVLELKYLQTKVTDAMYRKWSEKLEVRRALLVSQVQETTDMTYQKAISRLNSELPKLKNLRQIYHKAGLSDKHKLIRGVFEHGLGYHEGTYRTPAIAGLFAPNLLQAKEKGLIAVDETLKGRTLLRPVMNCVPTRRGSLREMLNQESADNSIINQPTINRSTINYQLVNYQLVNYQLINY